MTSPFIGDVATPDEGLPVTTESVCFHCVQPVEQSDAIEAAVSGTSRLFCCHGCRSVCEAIYSAGLDGFYKRVQPGERLAPPPELPVGLTTFDLDEVQEEFVDGLAEERSINLLVEGIHCAACVWLIENSLRAQQGVLEARVNLTGKRLKVRWNNAQLPLSSLLAMLGQLGYAATPFDPDSAELSLQRANRELLYRMAFAGFAMMNLMWISIALYSGADKGEFRSLFHWVGFCLAAPTLIYSGLPFYRGAWAGIRNRHPSMDLPIAIGASATFAYSVYVTVSGSGIGEVYYDTVVNFLFVILLGRYLEAVSRKQAVTSTQRLFDLQPKVATVLRVSGEVVVPIRSVKLGEKVLVRPGERIAVDGVVVRGSSLVDEAMLTGESEPVSRAAGALVCAGTINGNGALEIEVTGTLSQTALGRIIQLVEDAQSSKAPIQCTADRIVPWFVLMTLALASGTFVYWFSAGFESALLAATAVLIITCPCAFGLATPMSIAVATGQGARHGILIKNGEVLELLSSVDHVVFDKTGTLTEGVISVASITTPSLRWARGEDVSEETTAILSLCAAVERQSEHPLADALVKLADELALSCLAAEGFESRPGAGVRARVQGRQVVVGNRAWLRTNGIELNVRLDSTVAEYDSAGQGVVFCAVDGHEVAVIAMEDRLRDGAAELVRALCKEGLGVTLLSGDRLATAQGVASRLGADIEVIAEVMPEDKDRVIGNLQGLGRKVAMVGDGINDAPALIRADVGVALGSGTDVSIASADIVLISSELEKVFLVRKLARRTLSTIRQNIALSITYNIIMVPLAMAAVVTPLVAAITMPISSLLVIGNSARIRTLFGRNR